MPQLIREIGGRGYRNPGDGPGVEADGRREAGISTLDQVFNENQRGGSILVRIGFPWVSEAEKVELRPVRRSEADGQAPRIFIARSGSTAGAAR
jgi:hypothetical protein